MQQSKTKTGVKIISRKADSRRSRETPDYGKGTIMKNFTNKLLVPESTSLCIIIFM